VFLSKKRYKIQNVNVSESPTQRDQLSPVKSAVVGIDDTALGIGLAEVTDDTGPQPGLQTQITTLTPTSPDNEAVFIAQTVTHTDYC